MRIERLEPSKHVKGRFLVHLDDGSLLKVTEREMLSFALYAGMELDEDVAKDLALAGRESSAKARAAAMVGARPLSRKELVRRLEEKGEASEHAQGAADWLEETGAVNDREYAAMLVRHYAGKGYGKARIREEMRRRGVDRELWDEALEQLPDQSETLDRLIQKKCRGDLSDRREVKRVSDSLLRRGFCWSEVKEALRRYMELLEDESC